MIKCRDKLHPERPQLPNLAGIAAYKGSLDTVLEMREEFRKRRDIVYKLLKDIDGIKVNLPEGAFYFFPDVTAFFGKSYNGKVSKRR